MLDFLKNITLEEVKPSTRTGGGVKKQWNPAEDFMGIRIWKDGAVFPSKALVDKFNLEYPQATITIIPAKEEGGKAKRSYEYPNGTGNALDVIDSRIWPQYKHDQHFIAIAIVPKDQAKVDLFGSTKYNEDGTPIASVLEQGSTSFGKEEFLTLIEEVYAALPNEEGFIDLKIDVDTNLKALVPNGIFLFPKKVTRGDDKGKADYQRRENVDVFGIEPVKSVPLVIEETVTNNAPTGSEGAESAEEVVEQSTEVVS